MTYQELKAVVQDLHTQATIPSNVDLLAKMVLNKIARYRLRFSRRVGEIELGGEREIDISTQLPDFIAPQKDVNHGKDIYYIRGDSNIFLTLTSLHKFKEFERSGYAAIHNKTLYLPKSFSLPDKIYVPYYSFYLVLDKDGETTKEKPENSEDTFLLDSLFEDLLVEGVLLYAKRRELDNSEYNKAKAEWEESLQNAILLS
jgi:hypothetical protein